MKIAQVLASDVWGEISPNTIGKGLGGRETAMIRLAEQWAKLGHEVTNFVPINKAERFWEGEHRGFGFHEYVPIQLAKPMLACFPYDAVVAWEVAAAFKDERIMELQKVRLVHMQVAHFLQGQMEATEQCATGLVSLSKWAEGFTEHAGFEFPDERKYVRPNGVDLSLYPQKFIDAKLKNGHGDSMELVYSSSPDRGLWGLLKMWPRIRGQWSDAQLYVGYGVERYTSQAKWQHSRIGQQATDIEFLMKQPGVIDMGSIGQKELAELQARSTFWLYPCDSIQPTETGCITAVENLAAGNPSVISNADCLEEEFGEVAQVVNLPVDEGKFFMMALKELYDNPDLYRERVAAGREFAEGRDWKVIAPTWIDLFEENRQLSA